MSISHLVSLLLLAAVSVLVALSPWSAAVDHVRANSSTCYLVIVTVGGIQETVIFCPGASPSPPAATGGNG